ncbi:MAG: HEPN domain-containing protein [Chitinispirillia bacterium]|jgi:HEPN domain-containing protein
MNRNHEFALQWLHKAQNDLITAVRIIQYPDGPTDTACFHAQQTIEKALKGLLTYHGIPFPRIHHLVRLMDLSLPYCNQLDTFRESCALISNYAIEIRYPGDCVDPERKDTEEAILIAQKILGLIENIIKK